MDGFPEQCYFAKFFSDNAQKIQLLIRSKKFFLMHPIHYLALLSVHFQLHNSVISLCLGTKIYELFLSLRCLIRSFWLSIPILPKYFVFQFFTENSCTIAVIPTSILFYVFVVSYFCLKPMLHTYSFKFFTAGARVFLWQESRGVSC